MHAWPRPRTQRDLNAQHADNDAEHGIDGLRAIRMCGRNQGGDSQGPVTLEHVHVRSYRALVQD